jgi:hypothetical protein
MIARPNRRALIGATVAVGLVAALGLGAVALARPSGSGGSAPAADHEHMQMSAVASKRAFHDAMRKLWEDHITWTRLFIVSFADDLPDLGPTTQRLLQNQVDIGDTIKPFYGDAAADRLTELLTEHITTAAALLQAAKDGDDDAFAQAHDAWYRNADQIARFLSDANPDAWPFAEMRSMMHEHLDLTLAEAAHRLGGEYAKDIQDYDAVHAEILQMADMLSRGIIRAFPAHFA